MRLFTGMADFLIFVVTSLMDQVLNNYLYFDRASSLTAEHLQFFMSRNVNLVFISNVNGQMVYNTMPFALWYEGMYYCLINSGEYLFGLYGVMFGAGMLLSWWLRKRVL